MSNSIKVYIADDHNVVRQGMIRLVKTYTRVREVREASNGRELIQIVKEDPPDAVILDVEMPELSGLDAAGYLIENYPSVKILILTMHTEEAFVSRLMDIGVHGILGKAAEPEEVERALYDIVDKDFYRSELVSNLLNNLTRKPIPASFVRLSNREIEVLTLICQEQTPGEISARLRISEKTFFNHRSSIIAKTGARNNIGLYKFAVQHGFVLE